MAWRWSVGLWLLAAAPGDNQLPPETQAAMQMALLGIALVGLLLIVIILLGGHWVRRLGGSRRGPVVPPDRSPLAPRPDALPTGVADDAPSLPGDDAAASDD